jgi:hypothetical protein
MYFHHLDGLNVWLVSKTGNDSNAGHIGAEEYPLTLQAAKLTIGAAVTGAASGDVILVWPGEYAENVNFGSKSLTLIGMGSKTKIVPASGNGVTLYDYSVLQNVIVEALGSDAKAVVGTGKTNIRIIDCDLYGNLAGLYADAADYLVIDKCRIRGQKDGGYLSGADRVFASACSFYALGTYGTGAACYGINGPGGGTFNRCRFNAARSDTSSQAIAAALLGAGEMAIFKDCLFYASAGSGHTGAAGGIHVNGSGAIAVLQNCLAKAVSPNASPGPYDLYQSAGEIVAINTRFSSSYGRIETGGARLDAAVKLLTNKVVQTKSTGAITVYDDDGTTAILTLTPTESDTLITLTPS